MNLLFVSQNFEPEVSAAAIRLRNMVDGLRDAGYNIDVLTALPNYPTGRIFDEYRGRFCMVEDTGRGKIYRYWLYADSSYNKARRLLSIISLSITILFFGFRVRKCRSYDAVVVQTPQLITALSAVMLFKKLYGRKILLNVSDIHPNSIEDGGSFPKDGFMYKYQRAIEKFLYRNSMMLIGQSEEIIKHVNDYRPIDSFLYRNLQAMKGNTRTQKQKKGNKLVYAGLLSKTQGVLAILQHINFADLNLEFHIYGNGNEKEEIEKMCDGKLVFYHGTVPNSQMFSELQKYDASIVTLARPLKGAVPSKIYNVVAAGIPVMYIGKIEGEASRIINSKGLGLTAPTCDYDALRDNLRRFAEMSDEEYMVMVNNCIEVSEGEWNLENQILNFKNKLDEAI